MWHFQKHMALRFGIFKNTYISEKAGRQREGEYETAAQEGATAGGARLAGASLVGLGTSAIAAQRRVESTPLLILPFSLVGPEHSGGRFQEFE
jgi:hypothetical protein